MNDNFYKLVIIKKPVITLIVLLLLFTIISNGFIVQDNEIITIKQFEKTIRVIDKPGLYFKIPIIQSTSQLSKNLLIYETKPIDIVTKDREEFLLECSVLWKINNAKNFIQSQQSISTIEHELSNSVVYKFDFFNNCIALIDITSINQDDSKYKSQILNELKNDFITYGIDIIDFNIKSITYPQKNKENIYNRMKLEKENIALKNINSAQIEASKIKADADKEAKIIISKANENSEIIKNNTDLESAKLTLKAFNKDPEFYKFIRTLESYKKTLTDKTTVVLPITSPYAKYLLGQ